MAVNGIDQKVEKFMAHVIAKNQGEIEFHQAVKEVVESLITFHRRKSQI